MNRRKRRVLPKDFICDVCGTKKKSRNKYFYHVSNCRRRQARVAARPKPQQYNCLPCQKTFDSHTQLELHTAIAHRRDVHKHIAGCLTFRVQQRQVGGSINSNSFRRIQAFQGFVRTYRQTFKTGAKSIDAYFSKFKPSIVSIIAECLEDLRCLKSQMTLRVKFKRYLCESKDGNLVYEYQTKWINSNMLQVLNKSRSLTRFLKLCASKIEHTVSVFEQYGSGWQFHRVLGCDIRIGKLKPFTGGRWMDVPPQLQRKKAILNIKTKQSLCFKAAVLGCLYSPEFHSDRLSSYKVYEAELDFSCITYPVALSSIPKFERANSLAVNVFKYNFSDGLLPLQISKYNCRALPTANLLLLSDPKSDSAHYVAIRNINRLLGSSNHHRRLLCYNCLTRLPACKGKCGNQGCDDQCQLNSHWDQCSKFNFQKVTMPNNKENGEPPSISFENFRNQLKVGYVLYADFECLQVPAKPRRTRNATNTTRTKRHVPCGFAYALVKEDGSLTSHRVYRGKDAITVFLKDCLSISGFILEIYKTVVPMIMSEADEENFQAAEICHICGLGFQESIDIKCRDHNHLNGVFRGASHQSCNLNYQQKEILPVLMHNLRGYDSHLIVKSLNKIGKKISVIPTNSEKYMCISVDNLKFIDSLQFMPCSLNELVENLKKKGEDGFHILKEVYKTNVDLLTRKGVFPYDYFDSWKRFREKELPQRQMFENSLTKKGVSLEDYRHAKNVFRKFKCQNLGDYHDLYLSTDALLLACVFEEFRQMSLQNFGLDPVHYVSAPGLAWDAALKMSKVRLELVVDIEKYIFLESGIRGGISQITTRHAEARNKYMANYSGDIDDEDQIYLVFWDMVNLYGKAMQQKLPVSDFIFLESGLVDRFDIKTVGDEHEIGYILEVDITYPQSLHLEHQDYPLAVERVPVPTRRFSPYQKELLSHLSINYMDKQAKLVPNFLPKKKYICHYRNLKYYTAKGLIVTQVHRILAFRQDSWLKTYVDFNSTKRAQATNEFEKMFHKLCVNAVFGKGMESVRKRMNIQLVNDRQKAIRLISKAQFLSHDILGSSLVAFRMQKNKVVLNKAIYTGFSVLELSKLHMAKFHYDFVKQKWGERAELLMTDTDSLAYMITTRDVYEDLASHQDLFDNSVLPSSHPLYSEDNKGCIGKMKDEVKGKILFKFVGLGAKSYCFLGSNPDDSTFTKMAMKGVPQHIQQRSVTYSNLENILFKQNILACNMNSIRSYKHRLYNIKSRKYVTHGFDSKRYILEDGVKTLPYGHYLIPRSNTKS